MNDRDSAAARRAFIREHHPDRGGDPAAFAEGLARFEQSPTDHREVPPVRVTTHHVPRGIVERAQQLARSIERRRRGRDTPPRVR